MKVDPVDAAREHAGRVARFRRLAGLIPLWLRRSYRVRKILAHLLGSSPIYLGDDTAVSVHEGDLRWSAGQPRLLLVTHDLSASGAPRVIAEIARIFAAAGWFVTLVSPKDGPCRNTIAQNVVVLIDPSVLDEQSPLLAALAPVSELALVNTVAAAASVNCLSATVATLWYLHEVSLLAEMLDADPGVARALRVARRVFAGSELPASLVRGHRPDVHILPYGVRILCSPVPIVEPGSSDMISIAVFGAIEPRKGQDLAVAALDLLTSGERAVVRLTLYGRVLDRAFADNVDLAVCATPEVSWGGELSMDAYIAAVISTDIVLVSSRDDTLPLVSLDALGAGRVLICTPTTGTSAWIADGESGLVSAAADAGSIANALSRALAQRADWPSMGRAGRAVFNATFSEQAFAAALLAEAEKAGRKELFDG